MTPYSKVIKKRLPSLLPGRVIVGQTENSSKRSGTRLSRRRNVDTHTAVWQAVWAGFVASGLSQQHGCWVFRSWVSRSGPRGADWLCTEVKDLCVALRDCVLTDRDSHPGEGIPRPIWRWLKRVAISDGRAALAFTRAARALPKASRPAISRGLLNHAINISVPHAVPPEVEEDLEYSVSARFGNALRKRTWRICPRSKNAVREVPGSKGGYDEHLLRLIEQDLGGDLFRTQMEGHILDVSRRTPSFPGKDSLLNRLLKVVRAGPFQEEEYPEVLQGYGTLLSMENFRSSLNELGGFVHQATPISEQGCKVRVITVPPASVFTAGTLVRKATFNVLRQKDKRVRDFLRRVDPEQYVRGFSTVPRGDRHYLSADMTKATDGFGHGAIRAVLRGMARAGLSPAWIEIAVGSLGCSTQLHYVQYRRSDFTQTHWQAVLNIPGRSISESGDMVSIPMKRGCLMGTPLSFTVLSLINGWCCEVLGPTTAICGDDVVSLTTQENVDSYRLRAESVGSGLHPRKSFWGKKGWTFCEVFGLQDRSGFVRFFNPYPLKQFTRDGSGILDRGNFWPSQWSRLARVAKVLCKPQRAKARRLRRPPELPVSLGGLGHPSKGVRSVPRYVRAQLYTLLFGGADPSKFVTRLDIFFAPSDAKKFKWIQTMWADSFSTSPSFEDDVQPEGHCYVPNRVLRAHVSRMSHELYWALGGGYRECKPKAMKPGVLRLPVPTGKPLPGRVGWDFVLSTWRGLLDFEGRSTPIDVASKIRGFKAPDARTTVRGSGDMVRRP